MGARVLIIGIWYKSSREETWPLAKLKDSKTFTLPLTTRRVASLGPQRDGRKQQNQRPGYAPSVYGVGEINLSLPHAG
jgi:hypothetical protein